MTARPVGGDTREALREEIAQWLFHKVTRRDGLTKLLWEHLHYEEQQAGWLDWADDLLALPAVRAALAAQETVRRVRVVCEYAERAAATALCLDFTGKRVEGWEATVSVAALRRALDADR